MSRALKQRRGGRKAVNAKGTAKGMPAGVSAFSGTERHGDPIGGPKGGDPAARVVTWKK